MLVSWEYVNLIIAREAVHKGEDFVASTIIDNLVDEWRGIIVLGTSVIDISIINTDSNSALPFGDRYYIGDPIRQRDGVDKTNF